jgi:hypothetical protein
VSVIGQLIDRVKDAVAGKPRVKRSSKWPALRSLWLGLAPRCRACLRKDSLEVHHAEPVHVAPEKELDPANLVTLCRGCHLVFGHLNSWESWNANCKEDADQHAAKVKQRPRKGGSA